MSRSPSQPSSDAAIDLTYEEAYEQLEQILHALESGDLPLDESLALYERGAALAAHCTQLLDEAELRVEQWQPGAGVSPLTDWQES